MSKPCSWSASSLLLLTLACHRASGTTPAAVADRDERTPDASPVASSPDCTRATIDARTDEWRDGEVCVERLTASCDRGDADACLGAAAIVRDGSGGVARDPARALTLVTAACERGAADGCMLAATQHEQGVGVAVDAKTARTLLDRACTLGEARACQAATPPGSKGAASITDANLQVESIAADGLELRDLSCAVTGGMPMRGALLIAGTLAKQKRALDRCAPEGQAFAVTWTFVDGKARDIEATGGAATANTCVAAAVARTVSTLEGRCGAVVLVGKPEGAAATLDAVRGGP